jgi:protease IV
VKTRSVVLIIVVISCVLVFGLFGIIMMVNLSGSDGMEFSGFGPKIAVVDLFGEISSSEEVVAQLKKWKKDSSVKAIVLHIDSPGGGVAPSQEIYDEVLKVRDGGKKVIVSMGSAAASGGYYVACAADKIVANPGTITGSIGVILSFPTAKGLMEKIGLSWETIKSGDLKDVGTFTRSMTPEEERMLRAVIDDSYRQFVKAVADGRNKSEDEIFPLADGSIFTGRQAYNLGLVDTLGTFEDAISMAGKIAGLGPEPDVVKEKKKKAGFFDLLRGLNNVADKVSSDLDLHSPGLMYIYK